MIKAVHWVTLIENTAEYILNTFGTKQTIKQFGDSSLGNGFAHFFNNGFVEDGKYAYIKSCDFSVYKGGSNDVVLEIKELCKYFDIKFKRCNNILSLRRKNNVTIE